MASSFISGWSLPTSPFNPAAISPSPGVDGTSPFYKAFAGLSRHPWRKDQLFYVWLPVTDRPARFVRYVTIPTAVNAGQPLHLSIAFWDIIGAIPEKRQDLSLTIPAK